jgi:hypothetical protein
MRGHKIFFFVVVAAASCLITLYTFEHVEAVDVLQYNR